MQRNPKKRRAALLCLLLCLSLLCGCAGEITERNDGDTTGYMEDILPESDTQAGNEVQATLFFRYLSEDMLVGVEQTFSVTAEKTIEEQVVQALINGPDETLYQYSGLISTDTRIISVKEQGDSLAITLSEAFLDKLEDDIISEVTRKQLAVQSIVNSVTAIGNFSRVVILIDRDGQGIGTRLTCAQGGWEEEGDLPLEPMGMDTSVILTAEAVLDKVMKALSEEQYEDMATYLAGRDYDGSLCPGLAELSEALTDKAAVLSYERSAPVQVLGDGSYAVALMNLTCNTGSGMTTTLYDLPVRMVKEDVWKVSFASLLAMLPE